MGRFTLQVNSAILGLFFSPIGSTIKGLDWIEDAPKRSSTADTLWGVCSGKSCKTFFETMLAIGFQLDWPRLIRILVPRADYTLHLCSLLIFGLSDYLLALEHLIHIEFWVWVLFVTIADNSFDILRKFVISLGLLTSRSIHVADLSGRLKMKVRLSFALLREVKGRVTSSRPL